MNEVPVSIYFMPEWWDCHYHRHVSRPDTPSQSALEKIYLGRLRFLFEHFGEWGIGEEEPALGPGQIATVIRYGFDLVPALLGTELDFRSAWGFFPRFRSLDEVCDLKPVNVAGHPAGEWIMQEKERLESLYGGCSHCFDIASTTNNAFRILGEDVYAELISNPEAIHSLFETVLQTMEWLYDFLAEHFGGMDPVPISNCNVSLMGPMLYEDCVLSFDALQNRFAQRRNGVAPRAALHHCDVPVDSFLAVYAKLPGLASLQASFESDIVAVKRMLPGCAFSAMISPASLQKELELFRATLRKAIAGGAGDLPLWNIDTTTNINRMKEVLSIIRTVCRENDRQANFSVMPLCWEELEWAHDRYHES